MTESATSMPEEGARPYPDKWARASATPTVEAFHTAIRKLVAKRLDESGKTWEEVVHDSAFELTREDFERVEADLLATGYRFEISAVISQQEEPDKYKPLERAGGTSAGETDEQGRPVVGRGHNVFRAKQDVEGVARFVPDVETVMTMLTEGVRADTVAVIDDSGGTLTAPILGDFRAVLCMGGTTRSHLGILTREYNVPCLMAVELQGLQEGDRILVEYSKPGADAYSDGDKAAAGRPRIIKTT